MSRTAGLRPSGTRAAVLLAALAACAGPPPERAAGPPARVATLAPSVTEIVFALGAGPRVVGACAQCDYPPAAATLARVGGYLTPSVEAVLGVEPDLVIAVPSPGNREAVRAIERAGLRVLVVSDRTLADLWDSIRAVADALGMPEAGARLAADVHRRLDAVRARVADRRTRRVLLVVGRRPLIVAGGGTLQDELLRMAGGVNVAADIGDRWPSVPLEVVVDRAPEVILDAAMGSEGSARSPFADLTTVPAVRDGRVHVLAADAIFRAGPRVPDALAVFAEAIHPEAFAPGG